MKDSATEMTLINPRDDDESDVELQGEEMLWIEVAETPQSHRSETLAIGTGGAPFQWHASFHHRSLSCHDLPDW